MFTPSKKLSRNDANLLAFVGVIFAGIDYLTTVYGLSLPNIHEASPFVSFMIHIMGIVGGVGIAKSLWIAFLAASWLKGRQFALLGQVYVGSGLAMLNGAVIHLITKSLPHS